MYERPSSEVSFGDVFAGDWFFDAHLRRDAVALVAFTAKGGTIAWRSASPSDERDFVFAHGRQRQAVVLSDDCEIETILRRGGGRRLIFAAIERLPAAKADMESVLGTRSFRRFPLPPDAGYPGGVVEFQQLFAVAADAVNLVEGDPRLTRLDAEARMALEIRWNAYAVRRGPLAHLDHAEKFARLLTGSGDSERLSRLKDGADIPAEKDLELGRLVAEALGAAWDIEGAVLNSVSEAYERGGDPGPVRSALANAMADLAARAQRAAARLRQQ